MTHVHDWKPDLDRGVYNFKCACGALGHSTREKLLAAREAKTPLHQVVKAYAADSSSPADRVKLGEEYELWRAKATVQKEAKPVRMKEPTIEPVDEVVKIDVDEEEV